VLLRRNAGPTGHHNTRIESGVAGRSQGTLLSVRQKRTFKLSVNRISNSDEGHVTSDEILVRALTDHPHSPSFQVAQPIPGGFDISDG
jgi:hypothetical protein